MILSAEKFKRWRRYFCPVCGHVEWLAEGQELPQDYHCPLCGVGRNTMLEIDDPRLVKHSLEFQELTSGFWRISKKPLFPPDYNHYSYILVHKEGVILYDAPSIITQDGIDKIHQLGKPILLVASHQDFIGFANDWAELLNIPFLVGDKETPLLGNKIYATELIKESRNLFSDLELIYVDGHSPSSLALYWDKENQILCAGDILTVWDHKNTENKEVNKQLAIFQNPPVKKEVIDLLLRPVSLLATCTGVLENASEKLKELSQIKENYAKPWQGDKGGVWF